ncbi:MAG: CHY zinc finger protein [Venatoribacter sp.]
MCSLPIVQGQVIDDQTRCSHYHSAKDIIAMQFYCCGHWYPCYQCHNASTNHSIVPWPKKLFSQRAVLCGNCKTTLSISEYLASNHCPHCQAQFNEGCSKHHAIYFAVE